MKFFVFFALASVGCLAGQPKSREEISREECFAQEKLYHKPTNKCYTLLSKGPCQKGQWFVLERPKERDSHVRIEGKCVKEKCKDGEYYWSETKSCIRSVDQPKVCDPMTEQLRNNVFGDGECACTTEPPRARLYNDKDNPCHTLYTQGPCRAGQVLGFADAATDEPSCIPDPCYQESRHMKRMNALARDAVLAPWKNNTCFELGTRGPCSSGLTFKVHSRFRRPACVLLTQAIFTVNRPNCVRDINDVCQKRVSKKSAANKYSRELMEILLAQKK
ncbi:UNVERIFIED_CONTAM: hypothetical protein PYX00_001996 [Menopon gallinae]|uniref:DUF4789 domain-containing protein n=1 Tax=Menopon gallinae TaxID=328185 RepID=A0AAW2IEW3_9NEOP